MLTYRDLSSSLRSLRLGGAPAIAHASLSAFGAVQGGAETVLGALLSVAPVLLMPTFTYQTMLTPETGPAENGMTYGSGFESNRRAQFFRPNLPADPAMGVIAETLRRHPKARRSLHPILSFAGIILDEALAAQTLEHPLAPIGELARAGGWVLLLGVDHTVNTSIHYAEKLARRRQFVRWALTPQGVVECPGWPGCSAGFDKLSFRLETVTRKTQIGVAKIQAIPLSALIDTVVEIIHEAPKALLCGQDECERCQALMR